MRIFCCVLLLGDCECHRNLKRTLAKVITLLKMTLIIPFVYSSLAAAQISDATITDVTTRAFSVVWASDLAVSSATINVFTDAAGTLPVATAVINNISGGVVGAHDNGLVKVDVTGLTSNTEFHFSIQSTTSGGTDVFPGGVTLLTVTTAVETSKLNLASQPIVNDLINFDAHGLDGATATAGSIVLVNIPTVSNYPLSAFVGNFSTLPGSSVIDLNNLFGVSGVSAEVPVGDIMFVKEMRGLACVGLEAHAVSRFSKVPVQNEVPAVTSLEQPNGCFISDRNCDQVVNILDFQFILNSFNSISGQCLYNVDADIFTDQVVNIQDAQAIFNDFGQSVP